MLKSNLFYLVFSVLLIGCDGWMQSHLVITRRSSKIAHLPSKVHDVPSLGPHIIFKTRTKMSEESNVQPKKGLFENIKAALPTPVERKKMLPLAAMLFCILFNYTILRDTKDVLVVTAPGSGAEIIPFMKTYVNLPGSILFSILYAKLNNVMPPAQVFYTCLTPFLGFFAAFATVIYPMKHVLHPNAFADWLTTILPAMFYPFISILRNWTYAVFYTLAQLWGSVVLSLLFWGFANEVTSVTEAKKYYPLFGLLANVALIFSGQYIKVMSDLRASYSGSDPWGFSLKLLMGAVVSFGVVVMGIYNHMQTNVLTDPECVPQVKASSNKKSKKSSTSMSLKESIQYLAGSPYIRYLLLLVIGYGMSINIVEVTWKGKLKEAFPDPNGYAAFMGNFSTCTGVVTLVMMLLGRVILEKFGWGVAALVTPVTLFVTGVGFFGLILSGGKFNALFAKMGTTQLMAACLIGAAQNIASKATKYSLFDPCKEMAYIPLDAEQKTKGKAAIDVVGNPLGKSGGSLIQQVLIATLGSLAASTPSLAVLLFGITGAWIVAAKNLAPLYEEAVKRKEEEKAQAAPAEN